MVNRCILGDEGPLSTLDDAIDALKIVQTAEHAVATGTGAVKVAY